MNVQQRARIEKTIRELKKTLATSEMIHKKLPASREYVDANPKYDGNEGARAAAMVFADMPQRIEKIKAQIEELEASLEI